jgi:hypothetical protein
MARVDAGCGGAVGVSSQTTPLAHSSTSPAAAQVVPWLLAANEAAWGQLTVEERATAQGLAAAQPTVQYCEVQYCNSVLLIQNLRSVNQAVWEFRTIARYTR